MKVVNKFIILTFALLAWAFWIVSGGRDFQPEQRVATTKPKAETTRMPQPQPRPAEQPKPAPAPKPKPTPQPTPQPTKQVADVRVVDATRVNMRSGPSTDFRVLETLTRGAKVDVLEINTLGAEPWAKLRVQSSGVEGWMAARFLTK